MYAFLIHPYNSTEECSRLSAHELFQDVVSFEKLQPYILLAELQREITYLHTKKVSVGQSAVREESAAGCNWSRRIGEKLVIWLSLYLHRQQALVNMRMSVLICDTGIGQRSPAVAMLARCPAPRCLVYYCRTMSVSPTKSYN